MKYLFIGIQRTFDYKGRSTRKEFWYFLLFIMIILVTARIIDQLLLMSNIFYHIISWILFLPLIAAMFRRLHDIGKSGWWAVLCVIPVIGFIPFIFFFTQKSDKHN